MNSCLNCGEPVKNKYCNVSCQNQHQNSKKADKKYGKLTIFNVVCKSCDNFFEVEEREKQHPQKEKYYCSRSCANRRSHSNVTKEKISNTLINYQPIIECKFCNNSFRKKRKKQEFCNKTCSTGWRNKKFNLASKGGRASIQSQGNLRRSKNEMYFAELCEQHFNEVKCNEPIFNGWDADVIIEDLKVAVLWNGKWHYEQITESHSVEQVQNRDKIKIKEIENKNYIPYVIKDMGKHSKKFVKKEFNKFLEKYT